MKLFPKPYQAFILCVFVLLTLFGCGSGSQRQSIEGTVSFNGQEIPQGSIKFIPVRGTEGPSGGALIKDGTFSISAEKGVYTGTFRIEILASKETGRQIKDLFGTSISERVQYIPPKYNRDTTLTREITAGHNELSFDLQP